MYLINRISVPLILLCLAVALTLSTVQPAYADASAVELISFEEALQASSIYDSEFIYFSAPTLADTMISEDQPDRNFGGDSSITLGRTSWAALLRFDPDVLRSYGTTHAYGVYLALPISDAGGGIGIALKAACRTWEEHEATWQNAGCPNNTAWAVYDIQAPAGWYFFEIRIDSPLEGLYLGHIQNHIFTRKLLTKEAGIEWAPRLVVRYLRDHADPTVSEPHAEFPEYPYEYLSYALLPYVEDDRGIGQIHLERQYLATGQSETMSFRLNHLGCEPAGPGTRVHITPFYPFVNRPKATPIRYRIQAEDCVGNLSAWVDTKALFYVTDTEDISLSSFHGENLVQGSDAAVDGLRQKVYRRGDKIYSHLPLQYLAFYGKYFTASIDQGAIYWVEPGLGFPTGDAGVVASRRRMFPRTNSEVYIPWHKYNVVVSELRELAFGSNTLNLKVPIPDGTAAMLAVMLRSYPSQSGNNYGDFVEILNQSQAGTSMHSAFVNDEPQTILIDVSEWMGEEITIGIRGDWSHPDSLGGFEILRVVASSRNPDPWIYVSTPIVQSETLLTGVEVTVHYGSHVDSYSHPVSISAELPLSVTLTECSIVPQSTTVQGSKNRYTWASNGLEANQDNSFTCIMSSSAPSQFKWQWLLDATHDINMSNNQIAEFVNIYDFQIHLPQLAR
jgi:hypothetical protein